MNVYKERLDALKYLVCIEVIFNTIGYWISNTVCRYTEEGQINTEHWETELFANMVSTSEIYHIRMRPFLTMTA